jgi:hypothetical protein
MQFSFDLISDLHIETWPDFDWTGQPTSPYCLVLGDVARDREILRETLRHLGECYKGGVFYIDGNDEHRHSMEDLGQSYRFLNRTLDNINNVVYLQDNVVIINGVAILATNGWWGFDFDLTVDSEQSQDWYANKENLSPIAISSIRKMSNTDATYMLSSVKRLQTHHDVKKIVMVTHTVPDPSLIEHDIGLENTSKFNVMGNRYMMQALAADTENKIDTWCFGHYHGSVDQTRSGIRFVNNCRGRAGTQFVQHVYHPRRIVIDL